MEGKFEDIPVLPYRYDQPLRGRTIRLIQLQAAAENDVIRCKLVYRPLDQNVPYNALSYTWGIPSETYQIVLRMR